MIPATPSVKRKPAKRKTFKLTAAYKNGLAGLVCCSFCGLKPEESGCTDLISSPAQIGLQAYICNKCVKICASLIRTSKKERAPQ